MLGAQALAGWTCSFSKEGRTGKVTIASFTGKHEVASVEIFR